MTPLANDLFTQLRLINPKKSRILIGICHHEPYHTNIDCLVRLINHHLLQYVSVTSAEILVLRCAR